MLCGATNLICEKYKILIKKEKPSFTPIVQNGIPLIELMIIWW